MSYTSDLSPLQTWELLQSSGKDGALIDVRSRAEWVFVGMPQTQADMNPVIGQEWQLFPSMQVDPNFESSLMGKLNQLGLKLDAPLCFVCRTGVRSMAAASAMAAMGYSRTYNVTEGFEGDSDQYGHRGLINGWKAHRLPWRQN